MEPHFDTVLDVHWQEGLWCLDSPLIYMSAIVGRVEVPAGFCTDFASVPRLPFAFLIAGDTAHEAAVIHDYLYYLQTSERETADAVFYEAMRVIGEPWWRAYLMWLAVRTFGGFVWDRRAT